MPELRRLGGYVDQRRRAVHAQLLVLDGRPSSADEVLGEVVDDDTLEMAAERVRIAVLAGDLAAAARHLKRFPEEPQPRASLTRWLWEAVVGDQEGDTARAAALVARVVREAEREEDIGLFLDVGRPLVGQLRSLYRAHPTSFLRRVLEQPFPASLAHQAGPRAAGQRLTEQEMIVLGYLPSRLSNAAIAAELGVSLNTVKTHLKHIYQKLDVASRGDAIDAAEQSGLL